MQENSQSVTRITLLTRPGCHLCDELKEIIARVQHKYPFVLNEIDISTRPDLEQQFGTEIPVLFRGTKIIARYRITETQLFNEAIITRPAR